LGVNPNPYETLRAIEKFPGHGIDQPATRLILFGCLPIVVATAWTAFSLAMSWFTGRPLTLK